jgi:hypothetical protein
VQDPNVAFALIAGGAALLFHAGTGGALIAAGAWLLIGHILALVGLDA